jgi:hypothetical protein
MGRFGAPSFVRRWNADDLALLRFRHPDVWRDHPPPHIHAFYQGHEVLIAIETGEVLAGAMPPAALRLLRGWIQRRRGELLSNWERGKLRQPFEAVPGADVE